MRRLTALYVTLVAALTALPPAAPASAAPGPAVTVTVEKAVTSLPVAPEDRTGYDKTLFSHWTDEDQDGCTTRADVLIQEATTPPDVDARCTAIVGGVWHSHFDKRDYTTARSIDVTQLVPLAESWDSGANQWSAEERQAYANEMEDPRTLIAVAATEVRARGDKDPAEWEPWDDSADCRYLAEWAAVKSRWGMSVDQAELDALIIMVAECPTEQITYSRVR